MKYLKLFQMLLYPEVILLQIVEDGIAYNKEKGLRFTSNYFMYLNEGIKPIKNTNEVIEIPIYFADDALLYLNDNKSDLIIPDFKAKKIEGIQLFLFHPIHVALNSNSLKSYDDTRQYHNDFNKISLFT